jgi:hypothetical protein
MNFEYKVLPIDRNLTTIPEVEQYINKFGAIGWELVQIVKSTEDIGVFYFKRAKTDQIDQTVAVVHAVEACKDILETIAERVR